MIEENRAKFFTVSLRVPLEQGLPQGYKGLIVISPEVGMNDDVSQTDFKFLNSTLIGIFFSFLS